MRSTGLHAQFSPYALDQAVASGAYLTPADRTIVMGFLQEAATAANDIVLYWDTALWTASMASNPWYMGYIGCLYCEGTNVKIKNNNATAETIHLRGLTIA